MVLLIGYCNCGASNTPILSRFCLILSWLAFGLGSHRQGASPFRHSARPAKLQHPRSAIRYGTETVLPP